MDKQEAIELLECEVEDNNYSDYHMAMRMAIDALRAPEIIRCKDCKHKGTKNCVANAWTTIFKFGVKDDFYCGLAERRTDG